MLYGATHTRNACCFHALALWLIRGLSLSHWLTPFCVWYISSHHPCNDLSRARVSVSHNSHHDMHSWLSGRNHSLSCRGGAAVLESGKCAALQIMKERCCFDIASLLSHSAWQILSWTWWSREKCLCYGQKSSEEKRLLWCSDFGKQQARPPQCSGTLSHTHT